MLCESAAVAKEAIPQTPSLQLANTKSHHKFGVNRENLMAMSKVWALFGAQKLLQFHQGDGNKSRRERGENYRFCF
jgi:hypothetical protein